MQKRSQTFVSVPNIDYMDMEEILRHIETLQEMMQTMIAEMDAIRLEINRLQQSSLPEAPQLEPQAPQPVRELQPEPAPNLEPVHEPAPQPEPEPAHKPQPACDNRPQERPDSLAEHYEKNMNQRRLQNELAARRFADLSHSLSLNDRFRYQRELLDNDRDAFMQLMSAIDEMESWEDAADYLGTYQWDEESPTVRDFLSMIEQHFKG